MLHVETRTTPASRLLGTVCLVLTILVIIGGGLSAIADGLERGMRGGEAPAFLVDPEPQSSSSD